MEPDSPAEETRLPAQIAAMEADSAAEEAFSSPPPSPPPPLELQGDDDEPPLLPIPAEIAATEPDSAAEETRLSAQIASMKPDSAAEETLSSPPPSPSPTLDPHGDDDEPPLLPTPAEIAAMDPDSAAKEALSSPPPTPSPSLDPQEPAADPASPDRCLPGGDLNPGQHPSTAAATPPPPQNTGGEDVAGSSEVAREEEAIAEEGKALRRFIEEFGGQGKECLLQSPKLKNIATPDRPAALRFLGEKYNDLFKKYEKQSYEYDGLKKKYENQSYEYDGIKKKYVDECRERRRLYNELIEARGNIRVFCRCRPLSADEATHGCSSVVEIQPSSDTELHFLVSEKERKSFRFDHIFGPKDGQEVVFAETVPVVRSVMDGFNVCIFAYGQTGTGKTFTMEGVPGNRGVNYRALEELFRMSEERRASIVYTFSVSILEVYNEQINDLLDESSKRLEIKQNPDGTQDVPGLVDAPVYTTEGVWEKLKIGARNRSVGSTNANEFSSRSHSLVRVTVRSEDLVTHVQNKSYMWLVDLAGSERNDKTGADGERLKESQYINKSLTSLGDVMSSLASKSSHIPYRNSKLTHLLKSSLGGDCKTLMFVQISPSSSDSVETLNSLKYASRVRSIELGPARKHADPLDNVKLKQMMEKQRHAEKEIEDLKRDLQMMDLKYLSRENTIRLLNEKVRDAERKCRDYQQRNKELENELVNNKKAARDPSRSLRPPLVPTRQRHFPQERNLPPSGPSRSRFSKAQTIQNKENIPVMGEDREKAVGKARRVSLTPVMRQFPLQPKRRSSMAVLPSVTEQVSTAHSEKSTSGLSYLPSSTELLPGEKTVGKARRVSLARRVPIQHKKRKSMAPSLTEQVSSAHAGKRASRLSYVPSSIAFPGEQISTAHAGQGDGLPYVPGAIARVQPYMTPVGGEEKVRKMYFGSSSKFSSPSMIDKLLRGHNVPSTPQQGRLDLPPGPGNTSKLCFSLQKKVHVSPFRGKLGAPSGAGMLNPAPRDKMVVDGQVGNALRLVKPQRRQSII